MILHPLSDRVVAKKAEPAEKTASGILLAGHQNEKPAYAIVESVGPDVKNVKAGDKIIFKEYSTTDVKFESQEHLIVREDDILAIIK